MKILGRRGANSASAPCISVYTIYRPLFSAVQYGFNNEIETNTNVKDKEAFFRLINMILWNTPELNDSQERQYFYRRQGLFGRPMPMMFHRQDNLGMISQKKSLITIFGHKDKMKNFIKNFDNFH